MHALGFVLAAVIGISLGLMGGGGSILTVPVLVYVLGFAAKPAIAMSLPIVGVTSLVGALGHWRAGNVHLRTAALFGVVAMAGSFTGARAASYLSGTTQLVVLAVVMLVAAASMIRSAAKPAVATATPALPGAAPVHPSWRLLAVALGVGVLTGVVGIGGGFLIVPALVVLGDVPMKQAIGTSLLVIAMNSSSGFLGYLGGVEIPWGFLAAFTSVAIGGVLLGTRLVRYVSATSLKRGFAVFLILVSVFMLYRNRAIFVSPQASATPVPATAS